MLQGPPPFLLSDLRGGIFPEHLDVSTQGEDRDAVLGLSPLPGTALDRRAEPEGEPQHFHFEKLGKKEMAQFMNENQRADKN